MSQWRQAGANLLAAEDDSDASSGRGRARKGPNDDTTKDAEKRNTKKEEKDHTAVKKKIEGLEKRILELLDSESRSHFEMASLQSDLEKVKKENAKLQTENGQLREYGSTLVSFVPRELTHLLPPAPSGIEEGAQGSLEHPGLPPKAAPPEASAGAQSANRLLETQLAVAMAEKERLREELSTVRREAGAREKEAASVATGLRDTVCELRVERAVALEQIRHLLGRLEECRNENGRLIATMKAMAEDALNTQSFTPSSGPLRALDPYGLLSRQQQYNDKEFLGRDTGSVSASAGTHADSSGAFKASSDFATRMGDLASHSRPSAPLFSTHTPVGFSRPQTHPRPMQPGSGPLSHSVRTEDVGSLSTRPMDAAGKQGHADTTLQRPPKNGTQSGISGRTGMQGSTSNTFKWNPSIGGPPASSKVDHVAKATAYQRDLQPARNRHIMS